MLGRKTYTAEELAHSRSVVDAQLAAHKELTAAVADGPDAQVALDAFDAAFFNTMVLALDRPFVHRLRSVTGKDGNALNEVEMLADSLMNNAGILRGINVITYVPEDAVVKLKIGDRIRLTAEEFERLAAAFFAEIDTKFR
jgi:hypothetical protein